MSNRIKSVLLELTWPIHQDNSLAEQSNAQQQMQKNSRFSDNSEINTKVSDTYQSLPVSWSPSNPWQCNRLLRSRSGLKGKLKYFKLGAARMTPTGQTWWSKFDPQNAHKGGGRKATQQSRSPNIGQHKHNFSETFQTKGKGNSWRSGDQHSRNAMLGETHRGECTCGKRLNNLIFHRRKTRYRKAM